MITEEELSKLKIPRHLAIIMDGNGRWAKKHHRPRTYGHAQGAKVLEQTLENCNDLGIRYLTVYAFSTENWARPFEEVKAIMNLFTKYLTGSIDKCMKNNVRCRIIGDRSRLSPEVLAAIRNMEETTAPNTGITFLIAINYGGRDDILRGVRHIAESVSAGVLAPDAVTEEMLSSSLDTGDYPDPDLLIRTSGEERLSNFLLWQLAYAEFYFTDTLWPDFDMEELLKAIRVYTSRDRRFGKID